MAAHTHFKNEYTEDEKYHNLMNFEYRRFIRRFVISPKKYLKSRWVKPYCVDEAFWHENNIFWQYAWLSPM